MMSHPERGAAQETPPDPVISTTALTKTFTTKRGPVEAVRGVDLSVRRGEILGFLGPNGAGKTTTLRMLTTLLAPSGGSATVAGLDLRRHPTAVRQRIGYVAQGGGTDPSCSVREELVTQGRMYRLRKREAERRAEELAVELNLTEVLDRQCQAISGGQKRRVDIAMGLPHKPDVLFLDEPTTGLDPASRAGLWDTVRLLREKSGTTVFLTTHYLDEADALADRLIVIDGGRVVADDTPASLKTGHHTLQDAFLHLTGHEIAGTAESAAPVSV